MDNTNKNSFSVVELSNYISPKVVESYGNENKWVTYGPNNSFFSYIAECYNGSPTNRSVINSIGGMIYGKGLDFIGSEDTPESKQLLKEIKKLISNKDLRLISMDFKQYGQCALQVGYDGNHKKIVKVKHQPIMTIAKGKMDKNGEIKKYWYSADWNNQRDYPPKEIPAFGSTTSSVELLYIGNYTYSSGLMYYSNVDYQAGLQYCKTEEELSNFHLNNVLNGFNPGMLLTFHDGKPGVQEQLSIESKVKQKWGGTSKSGSVMIAFVDGAAGETAPTVTPVESNDVDKKYTNTSEQSTDKILISHRVTSPLLLGIKDAAGFSSNSEELISSYKLFNSTVINPFQEILIDGIKEILEFNKVDVDLYFVPLLPIDFIDVKDVSKDISQETKDEMEKETGVVIEDDPNNVVVDKTIE